MEDQREPSVWRIASLAICLFVGLMLIGGMFGGSEGIAIAAQ